jgi:Nuclease-related domain
MVLPVVVVIGTTAVLSIGSAAISTRWTSGFVAGMFLTAMLFAIVLGLIVASGVANALLFGADAEVDTADELAMLQNYFVVHDVHFSNRGNADHVVIGQSGIFVLETKYTNRSDHDTKYQREPLEGAAWQSKDMARHVRLRLRSEPNKLVVETIPVVVLWGRWKDRLNVTEVSGVSVVRGASLFDWFALQTGEVLSVGTQNQAREAVLSFVADSERRLDEEGPCRRLSSTLAHTTFD